jgi:hypothetical protein
MGSKSHHSSGGFWIKVGLMVFILVVALMLGHFLGG